MLKQLLEKHSLIGKYSAQIARNYSRGSLMEEGENYGWDMVRIGRLTRAQLVDIRGAFHFFDTNGDGVITTEELATTMQYLGLQASNNDLLNMMRQADEDGNGCIDFKEFVRMMTEYYSQLTKSTDIYKRVFAEFDNNGDGFIDLQELKRIMSSVGESLTESDLDEMIKEADQDGDGKVSFQEFIDVLK
ncbi:Calmodulin striated muscle [Fasciola hepatica]|uniref:Calmodulin striated muscle n=1 Tax=Fasciola hepatica TaxID=6192 RepID=A0A4E0R227_FASHE|nr:Calmodulin striated muscle [Fasciola hepatica]